MNKTIKKVLEELTKEKPDLSYIRGMLEVLADEPTQTITTGTYSSPPGFSGNAGNGVTPGYSRADESTPIPDAARIGPVANLG